MAIPPGADLSIVIAGGGTGGHLYPGIAVARELLRQHPGARVSFAGTARGIEARVIPREGFELDLIRSAGLKGKSLVARARGASLLVPSMWDAWRLLSRRQPDVVVGVGGYSSGPVVLLAALRGIPTLVLEQNAVPGLTNRLLARVVKAAAVTYQETLTYFGGRGLVTGNPVRSEFFDMPSASSAAGRRLRLLIIGGSQGAHAINAGMIRVAERIHRALPTLEIVHQTGDRDLEAVRDGYRTAGIDARVEPFLDGVATEMAAADLVVCRAGATTLAELTAIGRPAVLVPLPTATDDHQRRNARVLVDGGGAMIVEERDLSGHELADVIVRLLGDEGRRTAMAASMRSLARPDAAARIATRIRELAA
jgi:UDP-N-acetylglucosamine--N-acetylmuramyl-(pentapeptide) pyrophosphoryl-undecaprenol N-acetylglucosamine transferase